MLFVIQLCVLLVTASVVWVVGHAGLMKVVSLCVCFIIPAGNVLVVMARSIIFLW